MARNEGVPKGFVMPQTKDEAKNLEKGIREKLEKVGAEFPPYKLIDLIGKGNYGRVFLA